MTLINRLLLSLLILLTTTSCSDSYRHFSQKIKTPDGKYWIALFTDYAGIGDPSWHVYKVDISANVENRKIPRHNFDDGAIFWNYSEAGDDTNNASISIVKDRYIVFTRGGIYYSLYDLQNNKVLINDESPWHAFIDSNEYKQLPKDMKLKDQYPFYHKWAHAHLHLPIEDIINQQDNATATNRSMANASSSPKMSCLVRVPQKYRKSLSNPSPNGESEHVRYQKSYEAFWWNCVLVKANNLEARCPFTCSGTPAATEGCRDGESDAEKKITELLTNYSRAQVQEHLRSLALSEEAKKKIYPYFQETPQLEKVQ